MSNADNRKHLSLLESLHSEAGDAKDKSRRGRRDSVEAAGASRARRKDQLPDDSEGSRDSDRNEGELVSLPVGMGGSDAEARTAPDEQGDAGPGEQLRLPVSGETTPSLLPLSQRARRRSVGGIVSFVLCVLLPVAVASVYFIGYASDQYVAEFRFSVRDTSTAASTSDVTSSLSAMLGVTSTMNPTENYMVVDYLLSRQAVDDLQSRIGVRKMYARPFIDWYSRFDASKPMEDFAKYWQYMATATFDQITGTALAQVRAFTPEDTYLIANTLITLSEDLINEVAQRPQREAVTYAEQLVKSAETRLNQVRTDLAAYRDKEAVIDPTASLVLTNSALVQSLRTQLVQFRANMATLNKQKLSPNSTLVTNLQHQIKSTEEQLSAVEAEIRAATQGSNSLSQIVGRYEQLNLERTFAESNLVSTMQSLEQARANAMARRIFITPYVRPAMPQTSEYPDRLVSIATVAGACFLLWTVALLLVRSIREHLA